MSKLILLYKLIYGFLVVKLIYRKKISCKGRIRVIGRPFFEFKNNSRIVIEDNVTLNSSPMGYHVNMHSPVKLIADGKNSLIQIGKNTRIHGSCIHASDSISIGSNCLIAANCQIFDSNGHELSFDNVELRINTSSKPKKIVIENNVWIGINSIILPGVKIGSGSIISAGSIVNCDIPPMCIAGGNPVKVLKSFEAKQ
jgi:acetyltransferase-like isoleucine patch superfamily enzyme